MKKFLIVYYGDTPECVEGFPEGASRSCVGALHVKPGRQMTVTEDELKHLKSKYSHMLPKLRVLSEKKEEAKVEAKSEGGKSSEQAKPDSKEAAPLKEGKTSDEEHKGKQGKKK